VTENGVSKKEIKIGTLDDETTMLRKYLAEFDSLHPHPTTAENEERNKIISRLQMIRVEKVGLS